MTLEQIQAWEAANALTPDGNIPAEAVESPAPHLSLVEEPAPQPVATEPSELLGYNSEAVQEQQTIASAFVQGEPFIHVVAYLTSGPVEIVASIDEALKLYESLASALTQAQQAGALS